jgi:hypothetical protein
MLKLWLIPCVFLGSVLAGNPAHAQIPDDERILGRGDANSDGTVDGADGATITSFLYLGGPAPPCMNQADTNNDGQVDGSDAVYLYNWLYMGGPAPPAPGPFNTTCAADDSPYPGCETDPCS